jgi:hypothetical protein
MSGIPAGDRLATPGDTRSSRPITSRGGGVAAAGRPATQAERCARSSAP